MHALQIASCGAAFYPRTLAPALLLHPINASTCVPSQSHKQGMYSHSLWLNLACSRVGIARGGAQASAGAELEWGEGGFAGQKAGPSRGHRALAGWNAAISVPDEAWLALTPGLTLPSAGSVQMVVLACPPAWGPTCCIVRASGAMHSCTQRQWALSHVALSVSCTCE